MPFFDGNVEAFGSGLVLLTTAGVRYTADDYQGASFRGTMVASSQSYDSP